LKGSLDPWESLNETSKTTFFHSLLRFLSLNILFLTKNKKQKKEKPARRLLRHTTMRKEQGIHTSV